jgi:transcriptional regulator with XRE-family HTH domain
MSLREVEEQSRTISAKYQKRAYHVSQNALSAYERGASVPSIWKLSTLSEIYGLPYVELLRCYGIELTI